MAETRPQRDADYVLDLIDGLLGKRGLREHRFDWLLGDPGKSGRRVRLPVDSYWPDFCLVVEVYERQHDTPVPHFDKPDRLTVSGVHRGEQRKIYDERRRALIPQHGLRLVIVRTSELTTNPSGQLVRDPAADTTVLRRLLDGVLDGAGAPRPVVGNTAIEEAALDFVMKYERATGRDPQDTRGIASQPVDVVSDDRLIEIKAAGGTTRGADLWLEPVQYEAARNDPRFHLYIVENVRQGDPRHFRLIDLHGEQLRRLLDRARERRYYTVPWPVAEYDRATGLVP